MPTSNKPVVLAHLPTPLEAMPRLTAATGGADLLVKRDDCTGLAMGGNKARQLAYYFGDALAQNADTILITGAVQSNYVRMTAAAAAKLGLDCHVQLEERVADVDEAYRLSGNVLLNRLFGATLHVFPVGEDDQGADRSLDALADELRADGRRPYVIHLGLGHQPLGALGYVDAAREILGQLQAEGRQIDEIVVASGSGHTHAGLLYGLRACGSDLPVVGVCVRRDRTSQRARIENHLAGLDVLTDHAATVTTDDIVLVDDFLWPSYGVANEYSESAMLQAARLEGLILDPVYTAKSLAGAIDRARSLGRGQSVLFIHTGGTPGVFAYEAAITELSRRPSSHGGHFRQLG